MIGETTESGRIEIWHKSARKADIPVRALSAGAPEYQRPWTATARARRDKSRRCARA